MAVATVAATVIASSAETARPRRRTAALTIIRNNMEVCRVGARSAHRSRAGRGTGALTAHLARQTPDQDPPLSGPPPSCRQESQAPQLPESPATAPGELQCRN